MKVKVFAWAAEQTSAFKAGAQLKASRAAHARPDEDVWAYIMTEFDFTHRRPIT